MRIRVWLDEWQWHCCGTPFSVGDGVSWALTDELDRQWLTDVCGTKLSTSIEYAEDHHGDLPDDASQTHGIVKDILAIRCQYERRRDDETAYYPKPGTTDVTHVHIADVPELARAGFARTAHELAGPEFVGLIVDLDVGEVTVSPRV